jgi:hypothetical protein
MTKNTSLLLIYIHIYIYVYIYIYKTAFEKYSSGIWNQSVLEILVTVISGDNSRFFKYVRLFPFMYMYCNHLFIVYLTTLPVAQTIQR